MTRLMTQFTEPHSHLSIIGALRYGTLLIVGIALLAACTPPKQATLPAGSWILALGDSLTAGAGVSADQAWPALLPGLTGWQVFNGGVSGDTSGAALLRLPALLKQHDPVLVLVTLGGNDMLRHVPQAETVANLEQIITLIKAHSAQPVLLATPKPSIADAVFRHLSAPDFYSELAIGQHIPLLEDAVAEVLSDPLMKTDLLHPNAAGHQRLSEIIYEKLKSIGYAA